MLGSGPFWSQVIGITTGYCKRHWWTNLLYINNLLYYDEACVGQTWYLACDMQFFLVSPLVFFPLYKSRNNNNNWGLKWWGFLFVVFTVVPIAISLEHNLPPSHLFL